MTSRWFYPLGQFSAAVPSNCSLSGVTLAASCIQMGLGFSAAPVTLGPPALGGTHDPSGFD